MASSGERRLLFDTRGKRKHVIRVVYAILALLMGASLFLVVGPVNIGSLVGNSTSTSSAANVFHEQAERIEGRLAKDPTDEQLLLTLTRTRINAGNAQLEPTTETEPPVFTVEAKRDFDAAGEAWSRYQKQAGDEVSPSAAQLVASTYFRLAEGGSSGLGEIHENVAKAVQAQKIAAHRQPNLGSLSALAIYQYFDGDFAAAEKTKDQAVGRTSSKAEAKSVEEQLSEYRQRAAQYLKRTKKIEKQERESGKAKLQQGPLGLGGLPLGE